MYEDFRRKLRIFKQKLAYKRMIRNDSRNIRIMSMDQTLDELYKGKSMCRFGDGEMDIINGGKIGFQRQDYDLAKRLKEILQSTPTDCIIGIPDTLCSLWNLTDDSVYFWTSNMLDHREKWMRLLKENYNYGTANVTRCYIRYKNKKYCRNWFDRLIGLFEEKNIVTVEGENTYLGCGNDIFNHAKTVRRIICPSENAFEKLEDIKKFIQSNCERTSLIILALGPTATVLAYELSQNGYCALDLGHFDIEYTWFLMKVKSAVAVRGKYTNEVDGGNQVDESMINEQYLKQIIKKIS